MSKITDLINNSRSMNVEPNTILDFILELEAKKTPAKASKNVKVPYPEDFEKFWSAYGVAFGIGGQKKPIALRAWNKLGGTDKDAALKSLPAYKADLKKTGFSHQHVSTFLNGRTWESFETPKLALVAAEPVELGNSLEHIFLRDCRHDKAIESDLRYWVGRFTIEVIDGDTICSMPRCSDDFTKAFKKTLERLGYMVWSSDMLQRRRNR